MNTKYQPKVNITQEIGGNLDNHFQQMIGILHWAYELGRVDIITKVLLFSSHKYLPGVGHLESAYHIFEYFSGHNNGGRIVLNSMLVDQFQQAN